MRFKVRDLMIAVMPEPGAGEVNPQLICNPTLRACTVCTDCTIKTQCGACTGCTACSGCTGCTPCSDCTGCTGCTNFCTNFTFTGCGPGGACTGASGCNICSAPCTVCTDLTCGGFASKAPLEGIIAQPEALAQLKQQLKQAMEQVEQQERALDESMQPQTIDEVDQLEEKLQGALEELRSRRETLLKRASQ